MRLQFTNNRTAADARNDLELARIKMGGSYTCAQAWDPVAHRWAYPDQVLEHLGYTVATFGDTGGHGFAVTDCGLYLSSNGHAHRVESLEALRAEYLARGFIGKRLGGR